MGRRRPILDPTGARRPAGQPYECRDSDANEFLDAIATVWVPRLVLARCVPCCGSTEPYASFSGRQLAVDDGDQRPIVK